MAEARLTVVMFRRLEGLCLVSMAVSSRPTCGGSSGSRAVDVVPGARANRLSILQQAEPRLGLLAAGLTEIIGIEFSAAMIAA